MSKLTEQIFLSKWNEGEHEKVIEFATKLYEANPESNDWYLFNGTYERGDVEGIRELMKPKVETKKKGRWRAEKGDDYYFITTSWSDKPYGFIDGIGEEGSDFDNYMFSSGNYYQSREEAKFALERQIFITKVNDRIDELNDGWVADWENGTERKYYLYFQNGVLSGISFTLVIYPILFKCLKSSEIAQTIISEFGDDLKKYIFTN